MDALRELCVMNFPESTVRANLMAGLEAICERALALRIQGEVWIDGSFLTQKIDPGDIDFVLLIDHTFYEHGTQEQDEFIEWLISNEDDPKKAFLCHTDVVLVYPTDSSLRHITVDTMRHWEEKVYGYSVGTHEPKGIVVVGLEPPPVAHPVPWTHLCSRRYRLEVLPPGLGRPGCSLRAGSMSNRT